MKLKFNNLYIFLLPLFLIFTSCKISTVYQKPSIEDINYFKPDNPQDTLTFGEMSWWKVFEDPILHDLIKKGLENNISVNNLILSIKQTDLQLNIVNSQLYPSAGYSVQGDTKSNSLQPGNKKNVIGAVNVSYTFDVWGKIRNQASAVKESYEALGVSKNALQATLISQISSLYFTLRDIDNKIIITEKMIASLNEFEKLIEANYKAGFISKIDLNQISISVQNAQAQYQSLIRARKQIENALSLVMFSEPIKIERGLALFEQIKVNEFPKNVSVSLIQRRPNILKAEHLLKSQLYNLDATSALRYPNLSISLNLGKSMLDPTFLFSELSGGILGPIFNNNKINNLVEIEKIEVTKLANNYKQEIFLALKEIDDALVSIETYDNDIKIRQKQIDLADEAYLLAWVRYREGLNSLIEFLNIQQSLFTQQLQYSESYKLKLQSIVELYLALGGGWKNN